MFTAKFLKIFLTSYLMTVGNISQTKQCLIIENSKTEIIKQLESESDFNYDKFTNSSIATFKGTKYGTSGKTLKKGQHMINVNSLDCVTYIENLWAIAYAKSLIARTKIAFNSEQKFNIYLFALSIIRYHELKNERIEDRIHYFSNALLQLEENQLATNIAKNSGDSLKKTINYMSLHKKYYTNIEDWSAIKEKESKLSKTKIPWFPQSKIGNFAKLAQKGDIIAFVSTISGLDVAHVGIVQEIKKDTVYFSHASSKSHKVVTDVELKKYLLAWTKVNGILAFRPKFDFTIKSLQKMINYVNLHSQKK